MSYQDEEDIQLMQKLAAGEDLALNELMHRWRDRVASFLLRMVGDHATATDLAQETFVRLYTSRKSYRPTAAFSTYLFHIAANLARTHARWKSRHPTVPLEDEDGKMVHEPLDPKLPPDEAAKSTTTAPAFMASTVAVRSKSGALRPGIWAVQITTSDITAWSWMSCACRCLNSSLCSTA